MDKILANNLKILQQYSEWEAILRFKAEEIDRINNENAIGANSDETLRLTYSKEFRKMGIEEFFNNLDKKLYQ